MASREGSPAFYPCAAKLLLYAVARCVMTDVGVLRTRRPRDASVLGADTMKPSGIMLLNPPKGVRVSVISRKFFKNPQRLYVEMFLLSNIGYLTGFVTIEL